MRMLTTVHGHNDKEHSHAFGFVQHSHMMRAVCRERVCEGCETHDIHPVLDVKIIVEDGIESVIVHDDGGMRYWVQQRWNAELPALGFVLANPSAGDFEDVDPFVERCRERAVLEGFGSLAVVSLYALRSDVALTIRSGGREIGFHNDDFIRQAALVCEKMVHSYEETSANAGRISQVQHMLNECKGIHRDGSDVDV